MNRYYARFRLLESYSDHEALAVGAISFEAKNPQHANRKVRAGVPSFKGLSERIKKDFPDPFRYVVFSEAMEQISEVSSSNSRDLGLYEL